MELAVGELAEVLGQSQPRVSRHVRILADASLVERRPEGAWTFIRLGSPEHVGPALQAIDSWSGQAASGGDAADDLRRLAQVRAGRAAAVEAYFAQNAHRWDSAHPSLSGAEADHAVDRALSRHRIGRLLDVGTGTGRVLELLGARAETAVGIDLSAEMLRIARAKLDSAGLSNCEVRQADMLALPFGGASFDTVVLHQVLHFAQEPREALAECARVLAPGGRLLVVDCAPHAREELRQECAHARLGFEDEEVLAWLRQSSLSASVVDHVQGQDLTATLWLANRDAVTEAEAA